MTWLIGSPSRGDTLPMRRGDCARRPGVPAAPRSIRAPSSAALRSQESSPSPVPLIGPRYLRPGTLYNAGSGPRRPPGVRRGVETQLGVDRVDSNTNAVPLSRSRGRARCNTRVPLAPHARLSWKDRRRKRGRWRRGRRRAPRAAAQRFPHNVTAFIGSESLRKVIGTPVRRAVAAV